ncbi:MAG: glycosyltransferase [Ilumatobacteraceae bacterium]
MTNEVSIITPVTALHAKYLADTWQSLVRQEIPHGWKIRWYVQEDGSASEVKDFVDTLGTNVAHYAASGSVGGVAEARNLALARCDGEVVMMLDADDRLVAGAIVRVIESLESGNMWCGFGALDDHDGEIMTRAGRYSLRLAAEGSPYVSNGASMSEGASSTVAVARDFDHDAWVGPVRRGTLRGCWSEFGVLPFHPATFATFTRWVWEAGGWPGLARDEDTALILAISDKHDGVVSAEPNILYRRHDQQTSRRVAPNNERIRFIERLADR